MKAALLYGPKDLRIEEQEMPTVGDNEVLLRVQRGGICGSDLHFYETGRSGAYVVTTPLVLGHEFSGTVADIGNAVKNLSKGDRAVVEPSFPCFRCKYCKRGRYNLCPDLVFCGVPNVHGALREYTVVPSDFVYPIPGQMSLEEGAMIEPLAVGLYAVQRAGVNPGDRVAVLGGGPIGLLTLEAALAVGAAEVYVTDHHDIRLEVAKELGATACINTLKQNAVEEIHRLTRGEKVDVVVEAVGAPATIQEAFKIVSPGGTIVVVGVFAQPEISTEIGRLAENEVEVKGARLYPGIFKGAIRLASKKAVQLTPLISKTFDFDRVEEAFEAARNKDETIKVQVRIE